MYSLHQLDKRATRRLRTVALPLGGALIGAFLTALALTVADGRAATAQDGLAGELRTERLTLVGPDGRTRATLGELAIGGLTGTGLIIFDADGRTPRVAQGVTASGQGGLVLFDSAGNLRLDLTTGWEGRDDGSVNITGRSADGKPRFELTFDPTAPGDGLNLFRLRDANGQARAVIVTQPDGGVAINLGDREQRLRAQVSINASGTPEFRLLDEREAVIWRAP